jgi:hypothetical protein
MLPVLFVSILVRTFLIYGLTAGAPSRGDGRFYVARGVVWRRTVGRVKAVEVVSSGIGKGATPGGESGAVRARSHVDC